MSIILSSPHRLQWWTLLTALDASDLSVHTMCRITVLLALQKQICTEIGLVCGYPYAARSGVFHGKLARSVSTTNPNTHHEKLHGYSVRALSFRSIELLFEWVSILAEAWQADGYKKHCRQLLRPVCCSVAIDHILFRDAIGFLFCVRRPISFAAHAERNKTCATRASSHARSKEMFATDRCRRSVCKHAKQMSTHALSVEQDKLLLEVCIAVVPHRRRSVNSSRHPSVKNGNSAVRTEKNHLREFVNPCATIACLHSGIGSQKPPS